MSYFKYGTIADERPDLASLLITPSDATAYHIGSAKKLDWRCPNCGYIVMQKAVNKVVARGLSCPICDDGVSKPEKIVGSVLRQSNIEVVHQATFEWSGRYRYDFFIPKYSCIIEVHSSQHYGFGFEKLSGVTLEDQKAVDNAKKQLALSNGITNYLVVDARDTSTGNIVAQVVRELDRIGVQTTANVQSCEQDSRTSGIVKAARLWNDGLWTNEIASTLGVGTTTAVKYLNSAASAGLCDYSSHKAHRMSQRQAVELRKRKVHCVQTDKTFDSLSAACKAYGISSASNIIRSCRNPKCHAGEYNGIPLNWEYAP